MECLWEFGRHIHMIIWKVLSDFKRIWLLFSHRSGCTTLTPNRMGQNMPRSSGRLKSTEGLVIISSSATKQLSTESATDWYMRGEQPSGVSLLRNIRAAIKKEKRTFKAAEHTERHGLVPVRVHAKGAALRGVLTPQHTSCNQEKKKNIKSSWAQRSPRTGTCEGSSPQGCPYSATYGLQSKKKKKH